jgi:hypothetical protein
MSETHTYTHAHTHTHSVVNALWVVAATMHQSGHKLRQWPYSVVVANLSKTD